LSLPACTQLTGINIVNEVYRPQRCFLGCV